MSPLGEVAVPFSVVRPNHPHHLGDWGSVNTKVYSRANAWSAEPHVFRRCMVMFIAGHGHALTTAHPLVAGGETRKAQVAHKSILEASNALSVITLPMKRPVIWSKSYSLVTTAAEGQPR